MTNILCTKNIEFDAAHRIKNHDGHCRMVHGHRYKAEITFLSNNLNPLGMVIDFKIIKDRIKTWIDTNWDHNIILNIEDQELGLYISQYTGQKIFYLQCNPTAENLAIYLLSVCNNELFNDFNDITCYSIKLYETPNSYVVISAQ